MIPMTERSVIIEPLGGLGNQLFTYATGRRLANKLKIDLTVDLGNYRNYPWHNYELSSFASKIQTGSSSGRLKKSLHRIASVTALDRLPGQIPLCEEREHKFKPEILAAEKPLRLRGYFQDWRYFEEDREELRYEIGSVANPSEWYVFNKGELTKRPWVSIHVRRGNYLQFANMGIAGIDYYSASIRLMERMVGRMPLVVFSDDIDLVQSWRPLWRNCEVAFVSAPMDSAPIETLNLMALASHAIIANSTFSWWAAWLRHQENSLTIAPRPWLNDEFFPDHALLPSNWITLGR